MSLDNVSIAPIVPTEIASRTSDDKVMFPCYGTDIIKESILTFYKQQCNVKKVVPILSGSTKISLRLLDWFVTNYSRKFKTVYKLRNGDYFIVHMEYKNQLKAFSKKRFDPFCRHANTKDMSKVNQKDIIVVKYTEPETKRTKQPDATPKTVEKTINTTVGQLNFFKWALQNGIIDYVINHYTEIDADMNEYNETRKSTHGGCVYMTANKTITKYDVCVTVSFTT